MYYLTFKAIFFIKVIIIGPYSKKRKRGSLCFRLEREGHQRKDYKGETARNELLRKEENYSKERSARKGQRGKNRLAYKELGQQARSS